MRVTTEHLRDAIKEADGAKELLNNPFYQRQFTGLMKAAESELASISLLGEEGMHNAVSAILRWRVAKLSCDLAPARIADAETAIEELNKRGVEK